MLNKRPRPRIINFIAFLFVFLCLSGCKKPIESDCNADLDHNQLHTKASFPIGVAIKHFHLFNTPEYQNIVIKQFNQVTPSNELKPVNTQPYEGVFTFTSADQMVAFAENNNQQIHGHTLLWHNQIPYWMEHYQGSREDWIAMMKTHIQTVVGHYKGKIKAWDVVNEGFLSNGTLRNSIWKQNIGPEYLELAFRFTHEADPNALLFYNDFNLALNPVKREAVLRFFKKLKLRGVPIDGIGLQMHIGINFPERTEITRALLETAEEGFLVHISELDVVVNAFGKEMPQPSNEDLNRQADVYSYVFNTFKKLPKHQQYGITIWGVDDGNSWIRPHFNRNDFPLLFDANYLPKPAYCRLISAL